MTSPGYWERRKLLSSRTVNSFKLSCSLEKFCNQILMFSKHFGERIRVHPSEDTVIFRTVMSWRSCVNETQWKWVNSERDNSYSIIEPKVHRHKVDFTNIYQGVLCTFMFHVELSGQFLLIFRQIVPFLLNEYYLSLKCFYYWIKLCYYQHTI